MKQSLLAIHPSKLQHIHQALINHQFIMICGPSGVGKTEVIKSLCPTHLFITNDASQFDFSQNYESFRCYIRKLENTLKFTCKNTIIIIEDLPLLWTYDNELEFKRVLQASKITVVIIYNTSLPDPFRISKYLIPSMVQVYIKPTPKTFLKQALDKILGYKTPLKELDAYIKYSQGDIRQFLTSFQYKLCAHTNTSLSTFDYCTNILLGTLSESVKHYEPYLMIPFINFNCLTVFDELEDLANTLAWCSEWYDVLCSVESTTINNIFFTGLNAVHKRVKNKSNSLNRIENPFKLEINYKPPPSLLEMHARQCPEPVTFSDDDSIEAVE